MKHPGFCSEVFVRGFRMPRNYIKVFGERVVRLVEDRLRDNLGVSETRVIADTAMKLGTSREPLRRWVRLPYSPICRHRPTDQTKTNHPRPFRHFESRRIPPIQHRICRDSEKARQERAGRSHTATDLGRHKPLHLPRGRCRLPPRNHRPCQLCGVELVDGFVKEIVVNVIEDEFAFGMNSHPVGEHQLGEFDAIDEHDFSVTIAFRAFHSGRLKI